MKRFLMITLASMAFGVAAMPVYANDAHHPKTEAQKSYAVKGEVVAVDKVAGEVKLKHEAAPELGWSAATMNFVVADKSLLENLKVGDKVNFEITKDHLTGQFVIRALQAIE